MICWNILIILNQEFGIIYQCLKYYYPETTKKLENGEVDLEESVKLYEEGMNLKKACEEKLKSIESQIKKIKQENNKVTKEDFK